MAVLLIVPPLTHAVYYILERVPDLFCIINIHVLYFYCIFVSFYVLLPRHCNPLFAFLFFLSSFLPVLECGRDVYAHFQPHLSDVASWTLEWLPSIPCPHASGIPKQFMGSNKRIRGMIYKLNPSNNCSCNFPLDVLERKVNCIRNVSVKYLGIWLVYNSHDGKPVGLLLERKVSGIWNGIAILNNT